MSVKVEKISEICRSLGMLFVILLAISVMDIIYVECFCCRRELSGH